MPFILAGGGIRGNRLLQLDGVRHNRLLVTIASYMGIDISTYGDTAGGSGVIDEVLS